MDVESFMGNMEGALKPVKVLTKQRRIAELAMVCIAKESVVNQPNRAKLHREEPDASIAHVRVCEGWGWQHPRLLGDHSEVLGKKLLENDLRDEMKNTVNSRIKDQ